MLSLLLPNHGTHSLLLVLLILINYSQRCMHGGHAIPCSIIRRGGDGSGNDQRQQKKGSHPHQNVTRE